MKSWMASAVGLAWLIPVFLWCGQLSGPAVPLAELLTAVLLVVGSAVSIELGRLFEGGVRVGQRPHKGLSAWAMASVILLPAFWVLPVMVGVYGYARWRGIRVPLWKWVGSGAFLVLAALVAGLVLGAGGPVTLPSTGAGLLIVAAAIAGFLVVESALLLGAALLCDEADEKWLRRVLADPGFYLTEAAVLCLGTVTGLVGQAGPWFVLLFLPVYGLMQQAVLHRPLRDQATTDAKTGLLRYESWRSRALAELGHQGSNGRPWSVVFADLDRFKEFNDRHGHLAGDRALGVVGRAIRDSVRNRDLVARFGGEEFCMLLPDTGPDEAMVMAERIRCRVADLDSAELDGAVTISIGVAAMPAGTQEPDIALLDALSRADAALFAAKLAGRDSVRLASGPELPASGPELPASGNALPASGPERPASGFANYRHEAVFYSGDDGFLNATVPFILDGLAAGEPVMVAVIEPRIRLLRDALGADAGRVAFVDMALLGANPACIIPAWSDFVALSANGQPIRGIGEPIWAGRRDVEISECHLHEALLNLAVPADTPLRLLCPYDKAALGDRVIDQARHTHPVILDAEKCRDSLEYGGTSHVRRLFAGSLTEPEAPDLDFRFDSDSVQRVADLVVTQASAAGLPTARAGRLATVLGDLATTGSGNGRLRCWQDGSSLVCDLRMPGVAEPMIGRHLVSSDRRDLAVRRANRECDLVQVRSGVGGMATRVHTWL